MASQSSAITTWPHSHTTNEVLIKIPIVFFGGGGGGGGTVSFPDPNNPSTDRFHALGLFGCGNETWGGGGGGGGGDFSHCRNGNRNGKLKLSHFHG